MSIHFIECAAALKDIQPSTKLALMAFGDSADKYTHIGFPGLEGVMQWAGVGRSRAAEIVAELVTLGYLHKHRGGHRGRRAEYVVFPNGCCSEHPREHGVQDDAESNETGQKGSSGPESLSVNGSGLPDPIDPAYSNGSAQPEAFTEKGSGLGPVGRTPSLTTTTSPLTPASGGVSNCAKHPNGPGANCRACGTTSRQIADRNRRIAAEARRLADQQRLTSEAEARAAAAVSTADVIDLLKQARQNIDQSRAATAQMSTKSRRRA